MLNKAKINRQYILPKTIIETYIENCVFINKLTVLTNSVYHLCAFEINTYIYIYTYILLNINNIIISLIKI